MSRPPDGAAEDQPSAGKVKHRLRAAYDAFSTSVTDQRGGAWNWLHAGVDRARTPDEEIETPLRWGPINAAHARLTAELLGPTDLHGARVLESGCGRGGNLMAMGRWFDTAQLVGLDLSGVAIAAVRDRLGDRGVSAVHGDAESLPFASRSFDAVVCIESAGHYPDRLAFFVEVARLVRPGGWFLYAESLSPDALAAVSRSLDHCGFSLAFQADVGPRVRRFWQEVSRSTAGERATQDMTDHEARTVGPGADSELGRLLSDGRNGYHLMRWRRDDRRASPDAVAAADVDLVNPGGDHAAGIIESYGRGTWVGAVTGDSAPA